MPTANGLIITALKQEDKYIYCPFFVAFRSTKNAFAEVTY
jgi:hypothetical protein